MISNLKKKTKKVWSEPSPFNTDEFALPLHTVKPPLQYSCFCWLTGLAEYQNLIQSWSYGS